MQKFSKNRIKHAKRITKFDTMSFFALQSMEDLVRISTLEGETIFENQAMKKGIENDIIRDEVNKSKESALSEFSKDLTTEIKRQVVANGRTYSLKISPVTEGNNKVVGFVEVFRDITEATKVSNELFWANKKINEDIKLAKNIQQAILPNIKMIENVEFQFSHMASDDLSGDIFDVIHLEDKKIGVYIADVVGHGISASIMTMFIRQAMRNILTDSHVLSPSKVILELKRRYSLLNLDVGQYFTIIYALLDLEKNELIYSNAGHNANPIFFNQDKVVEMKNRGKFISNIFPPMEYKEKHIEIEKGDKVLFYTDGLLETEDQNGEFYGMDNLLNWINENKIQDDFINKLNSELNNYRWQEQKDDIAMVYMKIN